VAADEKGGLMEVGRITINHYDTRTLAEKVQSFVAIVESPPVKAERKARPSWNQYFMEDALHVATRSTCPRASVGCVMVRNNNRLISGYNGADPGLDHCTDVGCMMDGNHCVRAAHAEANAIAFAAQEGISLKGATCYVTMHPCTSCAHLLIRAGIAKVVYLNMYPPADGGEFLRQAGIVVERLEL